MKGFVKMLMLLSGLFCTSSLFGQPSEPAPVITHLTGDFFVYTTCKLLQVSFK